MKRISTAIAALMIAGPAMAKPTTCLGWVRLLDRLIKIDARSADHTAATMDGVPHNKAIDEIDAKATHIQADMADDALIQCSIELSPR